MAKNSVKKIICNYQQPSSASDVICDEARAFHPAAYRRVETVQYASGRDDRPTTRLHTSPSVRFLFSARWTTQ